MIRPLLTVSTGTLASRLLGFLRDSMIAALLGAGPVADAFLAAALMVGAATLAALRAPERPLRAP